MYKVLLLLFFILCSRTALAADVELVTSIDRIYVANNGSIHITVKNKSTGNCYRGGYLLKIHLNAEGVTAEAMDRMLSVVLYAKSTSSEVAFVYNDGTQNCLIKSVEVR